MTQPEFDGGCTIGQSQRRILKLGTPHLGTSPIGVNKQPTREEHMDLDRRAFLQDSAGVGAFALASAAFWPVEPAMAQAGSGHELAALTIVELSELLASGKITSHELVR